MRNLLRALLAGSVLSFAALTAAAQTPAPPAPGEGGHAAMHMMMSRPVPTLNLSAYGEVKVAPDMANVSFGVVTEAQTAQAAMQANAQRMAQVMAALRRAGIAERDVQTSGLSLQAVYDYRDNQPPVLRGYQATNQVTVIVNDLNRVGSTVDAVVAAGVNQINGIGFSVRDQQTAENAAREAAVRALQAKAELYARATGMRLVGLRTLSEGAPIAIEPPMPMYRMEAQAAATDATSVAPGRLTLRVDVQGVYELAR